MDVEKVVRYWLTTAADDWTAAEHLFQSGDYTCTERFCAAELKAIKEFGIWIEKMVKS